ncbi:MAG: DEAD/DEAH box helicase [Ruminococcaceae bacterium]|nr:DEAD/DEAH box helicase [Oscillospiraceae bacterium]
MEVTQGVRFDTLGLMPEMQRALEKKGIEESTPVQAGCIPPMREWKDVIAKAPTGTGKTFAFGIPIIEHIGAEREEVQAVILAPTRELAMQITDELRDLCAFLPGIRTVCLYGGAPIGKQIDQLKKKPQIVVATPGRLSDHMKRRTVRLDHVDTVILDEADRMLDMGFVQDVTRIMDKIPSRKNLGMFSATISREVLDISWMYQRDPEEITVPAEEENKPDILQYRIDVDQSDKVAAIARIVRQGELERVIVFCNTKGMVERLKKYLEMEGLDVDCIHGDIPQKKREQVMARFRRGELPVFIATDVAARGIDVDDVDAVFNYDVPQENEYYVHRIGRTGRAKRRGIAFTLVADYPSKMKLDEIAKVTGSTLLTAHFDEQGKLVEGEMPR